MNSDVAERLERQRDVPSESRPKHLSPLRLLAVIASSVFLGEVIVMFVLALLPETPMVIEALLDGLMITTIVTPVLILFLVRPMKLHIDRREFAEEKLRNLNDLLEVRVEQRTEELMTANAHLKREIEERKVVEHGLSRSAEFIETILGAAPCILAIYDVNSMACSFINDSVTTLLGYSPEDVLVRGADFFREVFSPEDFASFRELNARMAAGLEDEILKCECHLRNAEKDLQRFGIGIVTVLRTPGTQPKDALLAAVPTMESWPAGQESSE